MDKRILEMKQPILITGAARSGTSLVAGIINMCGAFGGTMSGPTINNRKGMFENSDIRNHVVKPYLRMLGVDPLGQFPLPDIYNLPLPDDMKNKIERIILAQGYKDGQWMYKGAKICLIWSIWKQMFPKAKWVIVRRKKEDIVQSCIKTGFMRAFMFRRNYERVGARNEEEGWGWWVDQHLKRFEEMEKAGLQIKYIWPEKFIENEDFSEVEEILKWLGLKWVDGIYDFVDSKLWKSRMKHSRR